MCKLDQVGSLVLGGWAGWANSSSQVVGLIYWLAGWWVHCLIYWGIHFCLTYGPMNGLCRFVGMQGGSWADMCSDLHSNICLATWQLCIDQPHDTWSEYARKPTRSCVLKGTDMLADMCMDICIQKVLADASTCWPEPALGHTDAHMKDLPNLWINVCLHWNILNIWHAPWHL